MNISQKIVRRAQRKKQPYHSSQLQPEKYDYLVDYYHVNNQERALCGQNGQLTCLCSREDFKVLPSFKKCMQCQWLLGHREDYHRTAGLVKLNGWRTASDGF
jgi:hypothetical protein